MRITVTGPCTIEADGPVLIEPLDPSTIISADVAPAPVPLPVRQRKPQARHVKTCEGCGLRFRGITRQRYHSATCKRNAYIRREADRLGAAGLAGQA